MRLTWTIRQHKFHIAAIASVFVAATLAIGQARLPQATKVAAKVNAKDIASGPESYLTHVTTDKPIYHTGESLYVRGVMLSSNGHVPRADTKISTNARIEIKGPRGQIVARGAPAMIDSTLSFIWNIPMGQPGGEYTVRISHPSTGDAPAERKFDIRSYRAPRLKSQIVFLRDGYGPGDTVSAMLHVDRAEGGIPVGAKVFISARIDGEEVWKGNATVDSLGNAKATFPLPSAIARGEGTLAMVIEDGGAVETASKTIPILLQTIDVGVYPEGGDLVAGLLNRVYVEGRTTTRKPADMVGVVVDSAGKEVGAFRTEHEGRGRFSFTPAKGETYSLRVTEPAGIKALFPLPAVKESGVVIAATSDVTPRQKDVVVRVAATAGGAYRVALSQRGKELSSSSIALTAGQPLDIHLTLPKASRPDGVVIATVYDDRKTPVAERLLFVQPDHNLKVRVTADRTEYIPGDKVTLRIATTDETGKPRGAVVGLTVTDSSVLEMIDKREQAPRLPAMVLLENDVKELADAHVYLDETNPKAPLATDLLLGTQGWRRFATIDQSRFVTANGDAARRAFAIRSETTANLPLVGNDPLALIQALPGYRANPLGSEFDTIGGLPMTMMNTVRDGLSVTDGFDPGGVGSNTILNPDMIREIRLILAPVDAESGRGNGQVQITTRSGTNKFQLGVGAAMNMNGQVFKTPGSSPVFIPDGGGRAPVVIREYAHKLDSGWREGSRSDFAETVYWNAGVKTDASGRASVSFNLSDSVTSFGVLADAFARDGTLGAAIAEIESVQPFSIEPKIPLQVTSGDVIQLPVGLINGVDRTLGEVTIAPSASAGLTFSLPSSSPATLRAKERSREWITINVAPGFSGAAKLAVEGRAGPFRDTVLRNLDVRPLGYPYQQSAGGLLAANTSTSFEFTLPAEIVPGSVSTRVLLYPTPLASMTEALKALVQQPGGCFEQTSSTSYPMVMAQQYFLSHSGIDPGIVERASRFLDGAYQRLTGFASRSGGYEWFGGDPGHEALTAYGLMQFTEMSKVRNVDSDMLQRTRAWLLSRRDGDGGFKRDSRGHGGGMGSAPTETANVYITWTLVESGETNLTNEIAAVKALANSTQDSYIVALAANILYLTGDQTGARQLMDKLARSQDSTGKVGGALTSITRSGGQSLAIEATALSALAWMRQSARESAREPARESAPEPAYARNVANGVRWIAESNKDGRFGSTQATVMALRALIAYDAARAGVQTPGRILLTVDGKPFGAPVSFSAETSGAITLPGFDSELAVGKHTVVLKMEDGWDMPASMTVRYTSTLPDSAEETQIGIQVALKNEHVQEGEVTEAIVTIANKSNDAIPTPVAIVGIPGGLEVRHDQLKELVKSGKIDAYEVIGREVVLYWRDLGANARFDLPLSLVAAVPGSYTGPASRAYLYYTDEYKNWAPGLKVTITPR